jgi:hypothetical protein
MVVAASGLATDKLAKEPAVLERRLLPQDVIRRHGVVAKQTITRSRAHGAVRAIRWATRAAAFGRRL